MKEQMEGGQRARNTCRQTEREKDTHTYKELKYSGAEIL